MRIIFQRSGCGVAQTPRHPEVNQQSATRLEPNNQILPAALERDDALPLELCGDGVGLERADEPWIADLHLIQAPADEVRLERESNRLDFGQFGHGTRPPQAIVSSTIERAGGVSSPMA
jgi:hypothetical protein